MRRTIAQGVEVIAEAQEPVFRANHAYWLHRGDRWYRSDDLRSNQWVRIVTPPTALGQILEPNRYINYRADAERRTVYRR